MTRWRHGLKVSGSVRAQRIAKREYHMAVRFAERVRAVLHRRRVEPHVSPFPTDRRRLSIGGNRIRFDGKPVLTVIWQYAWKTAWATEKSVVILGDYCILPNPTKLRHTLAAL